MDSGSSGGHEAGLTVGQVAERSGGGRAIFRGQVHERSASSTPGTARSRSPVGRNRRGQARGVTFKILEVLRGADGSLTRIRPVGCAPAGPVTSAWAVPDRAVFVRDRSHAFELRAS
jgi:hypothetical protein